jgi:circadian clock protein KaiC
VSETLSGVATRVGTGVGGLDQIMLGGLPEARATLVTGAAGTGKTTMAGQFLTAACRDDEGAVFVTFEEAAVDLRRNFAKLGLDVARWEERELWRFVDASPVGDVAAVDEREELNFDTLLAQIGQAVDATAATRVVLDSLNVALEAASDARRCRQQLRRLAGDLRRLGLTVLMTLEVPGDNSESTPRGFEQFVVDNVIILRNNLEEEKRRRTIEVLKMRGAMHRKGEFPFTVLPNQGIVVVPLSVLELTQSATDTRISSGNAELDAICRGGFFRDSVVLASGATGTGKTLLITEFVAGGCNAGERCLLFAFEESRDQIFRNARGWGHDFEDFEKRGLLRVAATYPETASLEDHLVEMTRQLDEFRPERVAIDSLSALERSGGVRGFREFIIVLTSYVKAQQIAGLFTSSAPSLLGGAAAADGHISTLTDSIILLRYVEIDSEVLRGITVLKMRGSGHDHRIRQFTIDDRGMHIGDPFTGMAGILSGQVVFLPGGDARGSGAGSATLD